MEIPTHLLMCLLHWRRVYPALQSKVYSVFRDYRKGKATVEELRAVQAKATAAVVAAAAVKGGAS